MKIAITANEDNLESNIDTRFGRCRFFLIIDTDTMNFESISNEGAMTSGGAGIQAAQSMIDNQVESVIAPQMGPNAWNVLQNAGIKIYRGIPGTVQANIDAFRLNQLQIMEGSSEFGRMGRGMGRGMGRRQG